MLATTIVSSAYAIFLANFVISSHVNITGTPGIQVSDQSGLLTSLEWGDLQYGSTYQHVITIQNVGQTAVWIIEGTTSSLSTTPTLPSGVTLTWDLATAVGTQQCNTSNPNGAGITGCMQLAPMGQAGSTSTTITMSLHATSPAPIGSLSFNIVVNAYSTPLG